MASDSFYQAYVDILPSTKGLRRAISGEMSSAGDEGGRAAGEGVRGGILGSIKGLAGPLVGAVAALGIGSIIKDSISNASDLNEAATAITAVFGSADATIQKFAAGAAQSLGQSTNMTLDAAKTFGIFGKAAGLSGDDLAGFSTDFVTLAGDLASFNNTSPEQAIEALGAGLRGESEPLRSYGVLLDDAALKARATTLGIYSGTGALTQQQKVLAAQAEILAQTSVQQGDFAKTSGGLANQQRILSAGLTNLSTTFGQLFLPVAVTVVGFLNRSVIPVFQGVVDKIIAVKDVLATGDFNAAFKNAFHVEEDSPIFGFFIRVREGFLGLKALFGQGDFTANLAAAFGVEEDSPIVGFLFGLRDTAIQVFDAIGPILSAVGGTFKDVFSALAPSIADLVPQIADLITQFSPFSLIVDALQPVLPVLVEAITKLATAIAGSLGPAVVDILAALAPLIPQLADAFTSLLPAVADLIVQVLPQLVDLIVKLLPPLVDLIVNVMPALIGVIGFVTEAFKALAPVIGVIADVLVNVIDFLGTPTQTAFNNLADFMSGFGPVGEFFGGILRNVGDLLKDGVFPALGKVADFLGGVFSDAFRSIGDVVSGAIGFVVDTVSGLPNRITEVLGGLGNLLADSGKALIQGFIDGITGAIGGIGDAVGGVMDFIGGFFPHSPAKRGPFAGSGWTALGKSGAAVMDAFTVGMGNPQVALGVSAPMLNLASVRPTVDPSVSRATSQAQAPGGNTYVTEINAVRDQTASEIVQLGENARAQRERMAV